MSVELPEGWYIEESGETMILDQDKVAAEIERLRSALSYCASWIDRWTIHVGRCEGGNKCTCGRTAILFGANAALTDELSESNPAGGK